MYISILLALLPTARAYSLYSTTYTPSSFPPRTCSSSVCMCVRTVCEHNLQAHPHTHTRSLARSLRVAAAARRTWLCKDCSLSTPEYTHTHTAARSHLHGALVSAPMHVYLSTSSVQYICGDSIMALSPIRSVSAFASYILVCMPNGCVEKPVPGIWPRSNGHRMPDRRPSVRRSVRSHVGASNTVAHVRHNGINCRGWFAFTCPLVSRRALLLLH